jgi:hypothetical protein
LLSDLKIRRTGELLLLLEEKFISCPANCRALRTRTCAERRMADCIKRNFVDGEVVKIRNQRVRIRGGKFRL